MIRRSCGLLLATLILAAGCNSAPEVHLVPAKGKVTYRGQPLKNATVQFVPEQPKGGSGPTATGRTDDSGAFTLTTEGRDGAAPGTYRVLVMSLGPALPPRYSNPKTALQVTVPAEGKQDLVLALVD
jgi:hypothetical protein